MWECASLLPHSGEQLCTIPLRLDGRSVVSREEGDGLVQCASTARQNLTDAERRVKHQWTVREKTPSELITINTFLSIFARTKTIQWRHRFAVGCTFGKFWEFTPKTSPFTRNTPKRGNIYTLMDAVTTWPVLSCIFPDHNWPCYLLMYGTRVGRP